MLLFLSLYISADLLHQKPCSTITEINYRNKEWRLITKEGESLHCEEAKIIIHNTLFQLIQFSMFKKNKLLILFNDQIPDEQLRQIHLLITNN